MTIFASSDTHLGHKRIIEICQRPFASLDEMNATLVAKWNAMVGQEDTVFHLGDFAWNATSANFFYQLNGRKHLIVGNHDDKYVLALPWLSQQHYGELVLAEDGVKTHWVMCHYPIESWNRQRHGSIHLHGHDHGRTRPMANRVDVGVDCNFFRPISLSEIKAQLADV